MPTFNHQGYQVPDGYTADIGIVRFFNNELQVLLIQRASKNAENEVNAFADCWALPGGFVNIGKENGHDAALRELEEETGIQQAYLRHIGVLDNPNRDPRGVIISNLFYAAVESDVKVVHGDDAVACAWFSFDHLPPLAFDHQYAVELVYQNVCKDVIDTYRGQPYFINQLNLISNLLGRRFSIHKLHMLAQACGEIITVNSLLKYVQRSQQFQQDGMLPNDGAGPKQIQAYTYVGIEK